MHASSMHNRQVKFDNITFFLKSEVIEILFNYIYTHSMYV